MSASTQRPPRRHVRDGLRELGLLAVNIIVTVSGGLVETLQAGPLIAALAQATAGPVPVACPRRAAEVARDLHGVGEVVGLRGLEGRAGAAGAAGLWFELRRRRLDVAMVCSDSAVVRLAVFAAGVPRRVGTADGPGHRLLSDRVLTAPGQNRALAWLRLTEALGFEATEPEAGHGFDPGAAATVVAEQLLLSNGVEDGRLLVAIAPGTGFSDTAVAAWPPERFAHLANRLATRHGAGVVLVGDERDRAAADAMRLDLAAGTVNLCGELNIATTAAVIARCDLLIAADTPLLHLAAAVGTASVGLYGPSDGRQRSPVGGQHRVLQALPDGSAAGAVGRIRVDDVLAGIESAL
jgi:ADP-heptose:LPS heptosyltransferase